MPQMTNERVRAGLPHEEDLFPLHEVSMKTAGVSHLAMCFHCKKWKIVIFDMDCSEE